LERSRDVALHRHTEWLAEWLAAITPTVFGILGWVVALPLARRFTYRPAGIS
jgi:hypothetical protein